MNGIQVDYELNPGMSSRFNQKMFGRISTGKKGIHGKSYYIPGVLDDIPHYRIFEGRVFVSTAKKLDFDHVITYCKKFNVSSVSKTNEDIFMKTGKERWAFHAVEKGFKIDWKKSWDR